MGTTNAKSNKSSANSAAPTAAVASKTKTSPAVATVPACQLACSQDQKLLGFWIVIIGFILLAFGQANQASAVQGAVTNLQTQLTTLAGT